MKKCYRCRAIKSPDEFYKEAKRADGLASACMACERERAKAYQKTATGKANMDKQNCKRYSNLSRVDRTDMTKLQEGKCAICKEEMGRACVDHCHKTGTVRGLLCCKCNLAIGLFKDNITSLANAIVYLSKFT